MNNKILKNHRSCRCLSGIVLLVTLVLLVVLATLGYTLTSTLAAQRHRDHYIIDYQAARYACDSAARYAVARLTDINDLPLIARPNEPDFSDLFLLSDAQYQQLLAQQTDEKAFDTTGGFNDTNDINDVNDVNDFAGITDPNAFKPAIIRGPYGPPWPFVIEPLEFEIGSARVRIEIEDENAKYPLGWALLDDKAVKREALAGLETFLEWMDVDDITVGSLNDGLKQISQIKPFKLDFKPIKKKTQIKVRPPRGRRRRSRRRTTSKTITIPVSEQVAKQSADFAKLFHCSLIDTESLARPTIVSDSRDESALKYMALWGSSKVNINTAPRHVLEAAFTFGGDAERIAEEIIQQRRIKPFDNIEQLRKALFRYSDSIEKSDRFITTASNFFIIRITATSGVARASTIIAMTRDGKKTKRIAMISG